jgi:hypothetical protein
MKKYILKSLLVLFAVNVSFAQTTATDFTTNDCNGASHHLFDELDNGDVIVICWVMPCSPCATYAGYASDAVQSFATSHPGRVKYYLVDDYANSTCGYIDGWASNYNIATDASFSTTDLDMLDYGTFLMKNVVFLLKNTNKIYYNKNDNKTTQIGVENAITLALTSSTGIDEQAENNLNLTAYPNPTTGIINVEYNSQTPVQFDVINMLGENVLSQNTNNTKNTTIDVSSLTKGLYFLQMTTDSKTTSLKFTMNK